LIGKSAWGLFGLYRKSPEKRSSGDFEKRKWEDHGNANAVVPMKKSERGVGSRSKNIMLRKLSERELKKRGKSK